MVEEAVLLEASTVNSYLLYKQTVSQPRNHLSYRRAVVEQMAKLSIQEAPLWDRKHDPVIIIFIRLCGQYIPGRARPAKVRLGDIHWTLKSIVMYLDPIPATFAITAVFEAHGEEVITDANTRSPTTTIAL